MTSIDHVRPRQHGNTWDGIAVNYAALTNLEQSKYNLIYLCGFRVIPDEEDWLNFAQ